MSRVADDLGIARHGRPVLPARFLVLPLVLLGALAQGHEAQAFVSPCAALGSPYDMPPCPVLDGAHGANEAARLNPPETQVLQTHQNNVVQATNQTLAVGQSGGSGQGAPGSGTDLTGGQVMSSLQTMGSLVGANAQFYFGDNSNVSSASIAGTQPSNFTTAAEASSTSNIAAVVFAIQAKKQVEQDSKEVAQLAAQASQTQDIRSDQGFSNKVKAKLVQELQLHNALMARITEVESRVAAFHTLADQTRDTSQGNLFNSTSGDTASVITQGSSALRIPAGASSASSPATTSAGTNLSTVVPPGTAAQSAPAVSLQAQVQAQTAQNALQTAQNNAASVATQETPVPVDPSAAAVAAAQASIVSAIGSASSNPTASASLIVDAFQNLSGDQADVLRQIGAQIVAQPSAFGLTGSVDQTSIISALATLGST